MEGQPEEDITPEREASPQPIEVHFPIVLDPQSMALLQVFTHFLGSAYPC